MSSLILLTGASSFTGLWIAKALADRGFEVIAPLKRPTEDYGEVRAERVQRLARHAQVVANCPFGSPRFHDLIASRRDWGLLAHHAADVTDYRAASYDPMRAVFRNTDGAREVFEALAARGAQAVIATASVFETGEGASTPSDLAVTPYGLAKSLSSEAFRHFAGWSGLRFGKFVVPSPYGAFEERRFGWYLFESWFSGRTPQVKTPLYVRDHIPATLLAKAYADFAEAMLQSTQATRITRPSGWIASQGEFALKVAEQASIRLGDRVCPISLAEQVDFDEPYVRVNTERVARDGWSETAFWDDYIEFYQARFGG